MKVAVLSDASVSGIGRVFFEMSEFGIVGENRYSARGKITIPRIGAMIWEAKGSQSDGVPIIWTIEGNCPGSRFNEEIEIFIAEKLDWYRRRSRNGIRESLAEPLEAMLV
jgi:hypothetical protein